MKSCHVHREKIFKPLCVQRVHYAETTSASEPTGEISASALTTPANHTAEMPVMFGVGRDHCLSVSLPISPHVFVTSPDGARIASSTGIDVLLLDDFQLVINDTTHLVRPPRRGENEMRLLDLPHFLTVGLRRE